MQAKPRAKKSALQPWPLLSFFEGRATMTFLRYESFSSQKRLPALLNAASTKMLAQKTKQCAPLETNHNVPVPASTLTIEL
jgi:hypothetical protein